MHTQNQMNNKSFLEEAKAMVYLPYILTAPGPMGFLDDIYLLSIP